MGYAGQLIVERSAEELLLEFERTGRPEPFEEIVRRYSGMVYHVCYRICRDKHDAEDATQAVFAALAVGRKKESGEIRTIGPWLRQVARRVSLDIRRGQKRRQRRETLCASDGTAVDDTPEPSVGGAGGLDAEEIKQLVKEELERMPVKYRLPLILHYFGGMSQDDMAKELGCRPGTLRVRLHRARGMLAKRLAKRGVAIGGGAAAVVFMVAVTRAIQSAVTDSLAVQFGYGHAATAGGVIHAATGGGGGPVAAVQGVAASKVKVACALVLVGACVVRAGAEVYEYIRPLQVRMQQSVPVPVNLDQIVKPLFDTLLPPLRVDATPVKQEPAPGGIAVRELRGETGVASVAVPAAPVVVPVAGHAGGAPVAQVAQSVASGGRESVAERPLGRVGPEYSSPVVWAGAASGGSGSAGGAGGSKSVGGGVSVAAVRSWMPFSMPARVSGPGVGTNLGSYVPPTSAATPPAPPAGPPVQTPPPVAQGPTTPPSTPTPPNLGTGGSSGGVMPIASAAIVLKPTAEEVTPPPSSDLDSTGGSALVSASETYAMAANLAGSVTTTAANAAVVQFATMSVSPTVARMALDAAPSTPAPTFRVTEKGLTGTGAIAAPSLDNSGVVAATANSVTASVAVLDLSDVGGVTNSVDNPPNGRNGWYVGPRGRLVLPKIAVEPGTHAYSWGESAGDETPDLVNSVRMTLHDVATAGDVRVSLVSPDAPGVPAAPDGQRVVGLWALQSDAAIDGGIDLLVRFDAFKAYALGGTDADVRLMDYGRDGWQAVDDGSFLVSPGDHLVGGRVGDATYFAVMVSAAGAPAVFGFADPTLAIPVVTPEPACLSLLAGGMFLLSRRRRGNM